MNPSFLRLPLSAENFRRAAEALDHIPVATQTDLAAELSRVLTTDGCAPSYLLAFSGGTDSMLLASAHPRPTTAVVLAASTDCRDHVLALQQASRMNLSVETLRISTEEILATIAQHHALLRSLPDYTQRILAVCELHLAGFARNREQTLMTGHGPEAVLGGFRRHAPPAPDDLAAMRDRLLLNLRRLNAVAEAAGATLCLPFLDPGVLATLRALRTVNTAHADLLPVALRPPSKNALQNGSGVHAFFVKLAKHAGHRTTRAFMESLVS